MRPEPASRYIYIYVYHVREKFAARHFVADEFPFHDACFHDKFIIREIYLENISNISRNQSHGSVACSCGWRRGKRGGRKAISPEPEAGTAPGGRHFHGRATTCHVSRRIVHPSFPGFSSARPDIYFHCRSCQRYLDIYRGALGRRKSWTIAR